MGEAMPQNMTEQNTLNEKEFFLRNVRQLGNRAVLLKRRQDGALETVYASDMFARMMECSVDEAMKLLDDKGILDATHQDDRVYVRRMLRRRTGEDGTKELTVRKYTAKGNMIWCRVNFSFIDDYDEHYIYCTYNDVTALKEYEDRLRLAYTNIGDNFYHVGEKTFSILRADLTTDGVEDIQGRDIYGTDSLVYHYSEILEKRSVNYPIFEERELFLEKFSREALIENYENGITHVSEILYSKRSMGNFCYVKMSANVTRHPLTGDLIAFITEEECNAEKVANTLLDKILVKQFDMVAYLSNGNYGVIIGDEEAVRKGSIFPITRTGEYRHYLEAQVFPVLSGSQEKRDAMMNALMPETVESRLMDNGQYVVNIAIEIDGKTYYKRFDFYPVDPEARFYIVLKSDTTDVRKEQVEYNRQLVAALDDAEQANMAKMAFLSKMSSEIMVPMNTIISMDEDALKESNLSPEVKADLDQIGASAGYLLALINDILDMSSIESGGMKLEKKRFSYNELIKQINRDAGSRCDEKGITYEYTTQGEIPDKFYGDATKLKQIIMNIIDNAVKFTDAGGNVMLKVLRTASFENKTILQFVIRDTGVGIEKEYLSKIFDPFSQGDDKTEGSGLGLSIAKSIANLMNGDIAVTSNPGVGSAFAVEVTLENDSKAAGEESDTKPEEILSGKRVLLAEDMIINAELMKHVLVSCGIEVEYAENGKVALEIFENSDMDHFDAILMDVRMPEMDGLSATQAIRALDRVDAKDVPIIALTANTFDEDIRKSINAGMNEHLSKPVDPDVLYRTLARMIGEREDNYI